MSLGAGLVQAGDVLELMILPFGVAWWLGLYLLARNPANPVLRLAGLGLLSYGLSLALDGTPAAVWLIWLPGALWAWALVLLTKEAKADDRPRRKRGVAVVAVFLVALAGGLVLLPLDLLPHEVVVLSIGLDLMALGVCVGLFDAFDEGETLRGDMLRSALLSAAVAVLFGGQVGLAMALSTARPALAALLYGVVAAAITVQVLASPIQAMADRLVLARPVREARAELREIADALPRKGETALPELDDAEFARLTRRALSHYGDLGKLVSSPLTGLPLIDARLLARGAPDTPVERARELKGVLLDSITRLKPAAGDFGTSEEWRHYSALYFYYVVGIRPYSVRTKLTDLDPTARRALSWFSNQVPERTLHNWQAAAAKLVAADLRASTIDA